MWHIVNNLVSDTGKRVPGKIPIFHKCPKISDREIRFLYLKINCWRKCQDNVCSFSCVETILFLWTSEVSNAETERLLVTVASLEVMKNILCNEQNLLVFLSELNVHRVCTVFTVIINTTFMHFEYIQALSIKFYGINKKGKRECLLLLIFLSYSIPSNSFMLEKRACMYPSLQG